MKLCTQTIFALTLTALLTTSAQTAQAESLSETEAANASGVNDTFRTADYYTIGSELQGTIGTANDVDVFEFIAETPTWADFAFQSEGNCVFQLWNSYGYLLDYITGSGTLAWPLEAGELYYIRVIGNNDASHSYTVTSSY
jgi:hypothetical protein